MGLRRCPLCDTERWIDLPRIGPPSMASDWRLVPEALAKRACAQCGLVCALDAGDTAMFVHGYSLYAHPPGDGREDARQEQYATWLADTLPPPPPRQVLDVGCGNGSLLRALARRWPHALMMGCDLSVDSVAHGRSSGLTLWTSTPEDLPADVSADLVLAVNVIEHTLDPAAFLDALRRRVRPNGRVAVVCPDGTRPDLELLISDHRYSLERAHIETLAARAGLAASRWSAAPSSLGAFQLLIAAPGETVAVPVVPPVAAGTLRAKTEWLRRWSELDDRLLARIDAGPVVCFGMGEAAGLLRAYAPRTWARVDACTADRVTGARFPGLPAVPLADVDPERPLLVAVRPQDQPALVSRLSERFSRVVAWYDLVAPAHV